MSSHSAADGFKSFHFLLVLFAISFVRVAYIVEYIRWLAKIHQPLAFCCAVCIESEIFSIFPFSFIIKCVVFFWIAVKCRCYGLCPFELFAYFLLHPSANIVYGAHTISFIHMCLVFWVCFVPKNAKECQF